MYIQEYMTLTCIQGFMTLIYDIHIYAHIMCYYNKLNYTLTCSCMFFLIFSSCALNNCSFPSSLGLSSRLKSVRIPSIDTVSYACFVYWNQSVHISSRYEYMYSCIYSYIDIPTYVNMTKGVNRHWQIDMTCNMDWDKYLTVHSIIQS